MGSDRTGQICDPPAGLEGEVGHVQFFVGEKIFANASEVEVEAADLIEEATPNAVVESAWGESGLLDIYGMLTEVVESEVSGEVLGEPERFGAIFFPNQSDFTTRNCQFFVLGVGVDKGLEPAGRGDRIVVEVSQDGRGG